MTNDPDIRVRRCLMHHMLTTAKADFKPDIFAPEKRVQIYVGTIWIRLPRNISRRQRREICIDPLFLGLAQAFTLEATIKIAPRCA